jgi:hypothetical protein
MGLHLSFGFGPIRYTTSSRRRYRTKAQIEAKRQSNAADAKLFVMLVALVLLAAAFAVWSAAVLAAWLLWLPVVCVVSLARLDPGWFARHWTVPLHAGPWHSREKQAS